MSHSECPSHLGPTTSAAPISLGPAIWTRPLWRCTWRRSHSLRAQPSNTSAEPVQARPTRPAHLVPAILSHFGMTNSAGPVAEQTGSSHLGGAYSGSTHTHRRAYVGPTTAARQRVIPQPNHATDKVLATLGSAVNASGTKPAQPSPPTRPTWRCLCSMASHPYGTAGRMHIPTNGQGGGSPTPQQRRRDKHQLDHISKEGDGMEQRLLRALDHRSWWSAARRPQWRGHQFGSVSIPAAHLLERH
jgi:hypothetical protein